MAFDQNLDKAIRSAFAAQGTRLAPDARTSEIAEQLLTNHQITASVDTGTLKLEQNGSVISTGSALSAFVAKTPSHFIVPGGQVRSTADLQPANTPEGVQQRVDLIAARGLEGYTAVVAAPHLRPGVVANREMSKRDWFNLTPDEKSQAISLDPDVVGIVMARRG